MEKKEAELLEKLLRGLLQGEEEEVEEVEISLKRRNEILQIKTKEIVLATDAGMTLRCSGEFLDQTVLFLFKEREASLVKLISFLEGMIDEEGDKN